MKSDRKKINIIWYDLYMESLKNDTNELICKTEADSQMHTEWIYGYQKGKVGGGIN